jgi:hypothetical protein
VNGGTSSKGCHVENMVRLEVAPPGVAIKWRTESQQAGPLCPFATRPTADAAVQGDLRRADERQERAVRNLIQSFAFGAPGDGGGHHGVGGSPGRTRGPLIPRAPRAAMSWSAGGQRSAQRQSGAAVKRRSSAGALVSRMAHRLGGISRKTSGPTAKPRRWSSVGPAEAQLLRGTHSGIYRGEPKPGDRVALLGRVQDAPHSPASVQH